MANHGGTLEVHEGTIPHELLDESSAFLESLRLAATTGKRRLMGKTLLDPKKDSKWDRGRTRQVLHFGAHVRGGKAVGAEVEELPACLAKAVRLLHARGFLRPSSGQEGADETTPKKRVVAVTVDFFRKGSYTPALAATSPLVGTEFSPSSGIGIPRGGGKGGGNTAAPYSEAESDTEAVVCMLWLQRGGGQVVVGNTQQLAKFRKGGPSNEEARSDCDGKGERSAPPDPPEAEVAAGEGVGSKGAADAGDAEGVFSGLERISGPRGSVIVWDGARAPVGLQVAVPRAPRDAVLVSFQTLTPAASSRVTENRRAREEARVKAAALRRAAKEAKEAKAKGPIPGTPVVVADWKAHKQARENGESSSGSASHCSAGMANGTGGDGGDGIAGGCDGRQGGEDDGKTPSIEKEHVQAVYDTIAPHWSHTRYKPWPKVEKFLNDLPPCSLVADAGCGNGKYLGCDAAGGTLLGSDASVNLLRVCKERLPEAEVLASDCMRLPYRSGMFDAAISIAVLHHFSSEARRLRALSELRRLLRPGGRVLVYAWAIEQEQDSRRSFAAQDVLVPWHLADHHNRLPRGQRKDETNANANTNMVTEDGGSGDNNNSSNATAVNFEPDQPETHHAEGSSSSSSSSASTSIGAEGASGGGTAAEGPSCAPTPTAPRHGVRMNATDGSGAGSVVYQRYCHVYAEGELEGLVERVDGLRLVESYYDRSNWCVVAEREGAS
eukprot:g20124.t2